MLSKVSGVLLLFSCVIGCGVDGMSSGQTDAGEPEDLAPAFAAEVIETTAGEGGGFGNENMPDAVLGAPTGGGEGAGSRDVYSLGIGGSITLAFSAPCPNGPGPDIIVFENAFRFGPNGVFAEAGAVSVAPVEAQASAGALDASAFATFDCSPEDPAPNGCAGMTPVLANADANALDPQDPSAAGGDAFDFDTLVAEGSLDIAPQSITFVRITDVGGIAGDDGTSGFDLDAIACVHGDG